MAHAARHSRASSAGRCSGRQLERLVGHLTIGALLRREYLSIFSAVYLFSAKYRDEGAELWPAVRRELRWAASLLPPLRRDLAAKWATQVAASDASPRGRGATVATADEELVRSVGQRNERWRFARSSEEGAHVVSSPPWLGAASRRRTRMPGARAISRTAPTISPRCLLICWIGAGRPSQPTGG